MASYTSYSAEELRFADYQQAPECRPGASRVRCTRFTALESAVAAEQQPWPANKQSQQQQDDTQASFAFNQPKREELQNQGSSAGVKDSNAAPFVFGTRKGRIHRRSPHNKPAASFAAAPWGQQVITGGGFDALLSGPGFSIHTPAFSFPSATTTGPTVPGQAANSSSTGAAEQVSSCQDQPTSSTPRQAASVDTESTVKATQQQPDCEQQAMKQEPLHGVSQQEQQILLQEILNKLNALSTAAPTAPTPAAAAVPASPALQAVDSSGYSAVYAAGYTAGHAAGFSAGMAAAQTMMLAQLQQPQQQQQQQGMGLLHPVTPNMYGVPSAAAAAPVRGVPAVPTQHQRQQTPCPPTAVAAQASSTDDSCTAGVPDTAVTTSKQSTAATIATSSAVAGSSDTCSEPAAATPVNSSILSSPHHATNTTDTVHLTTEPQPAAAEAAVDGAAVEGTKPGDIVAPAAMPHEGDTIPTGQSVAQHSTAKDWTLV